MPPITLPPVPNPDDFFKRVLKQPDPSQRIAKEAQKKIDEVDEVLANNAKTDAQLLELLQNKIDDLHKKAVQNDLELEKSIKDINTKKNLKEKGINDYIKKVFGLFTNFKSNVDAFNRRVDATITKSLEKLTSPITKYFYSPEQKVAIEKYNETVKKLSSAYSYITDKVSTAFKGITGVAMEGFLWASTIANCVSQFFLSGIMGGWNLIDKFLTTLTGPVWGTIKSVIGVAASVAMWVANIGITALTYVWKGISTIFSVGYTVIAAATKYLLKGVGFFLDFWFKGLVNSIFSPLFFINVPLFLGLTVVFTSVFLGMLGLLAPVMDVIFTTSLAGIETIGGWVWTGIVSTFEWLQKEYHTLGLDKYINPIVKTIGDGILNWFGKNKTIQTVVLWIEKMYNEASSVVMPIVDWLGNKITAIENFFNTTSKDTLLGTYIDFLNQHTGIPGVIEARDFLVSSFGFVTDKTGGQSYTIKLRNSIEIEKEKAYQEALENALIAAPKTANPNDVISKEISALSSSPFGGLSPEIISRLVDQAKKVASTRSTLTSEKTFGQRNALLQRLDAELTYIHNNQLNFLDPKVRDNIDQLITQMQSIKNTQANILQTSTDKIDDQNDYFKQLSNQNALQSFQLTPEQISSANYESPALLGYTESQVHNFANSIREHVAVYQYWLYKAGQYFVVQNYDDGSSAITGTGQPNSDDPIVQWSQQDINIKQPDQNDPNSALQTVLPEQPPATKFANGGIVVNKNIIPLNSIGMDYIREKVKQIPVPENNVNKNDGINNITIIEEHSNIDDSYELYTMKQISKGLLGVK